MRVFIYSHINTKKIKRLLLKNGFAVSNYKPDIIISYGGDGTTLSAERKYPEIPKLVVKTSKISHPYEIDEKMLSLTLKKIKKGRYKIIEEIKLVGIFRNKKLVGLNEIQIHTKYPTKALRFSVYLNEKAFENLIGDGVVVSTPFGSTAYYKSLGCKSFKRGIGIGFNNIHNEKMKCMRIKSEDYVKIKILRGCGILAADNNPKMYTLNPGDEIEIKKYEKPAKFIQVL